MKLTREEFQLASAIRAGMFTWSSLVRVMQQVAAQPRAGKRHRQPQMQPLPYSEAELRLKETLKSLAQRCGISFVGKKSRYKDLVLRLVPRLVENKFGRSLSGHVKGGQAYLDRLADVSLPEEHEELISRLRAGEGMHVWRDAKQAVTRFKDWLERKLMKLSPELARHIFPPKRRRRCSPTARALSLALETAW